MTLLNNVQNAKVEIGNWKGNRNDCRLTITNIELLNSVAVKSLNEKEQRLNVDKSINECVEKASLRWLTAWEKTAKIVLNTDIRNEVKVKSLLYV